MISIIGGELLRGRTFWTGSIVKDCIERNKPVWSNLSITGAKVLEPGMDFRKIKSRFRSRTVVIDEFKSKDWIDRRYKEKPFIQFLKSITENRLVEVYLGIGPLAVIKYGIYDLVSTFLWTMEDPDGFIRVCEIRGRGK